MNTLNPTRRQFLKSGAIAGGGVAFGFTLTGCGGGIEAFPFEEVAGAFVPNALLQITPESEIIFYCPRDEMGQ
ncbi:MAG: twin-arginine translocation signal domain-containing protein, partial [Pseudomonadales bacterium]